MGAARKMEDLPPVTITNLQKVGALIYRAKRTDPTKVAEQVTIPAGETGIVPAHIWDRYKERPDVIKNDRVLFVIGGIKPGEEMKTPNAQEIANRMRTKDLDKRYAELEDYEKQLEAKRAEILAMTDAEG